MNGFQNKKTYIYELWKNTENTLKENLLGLRILKIPELCYEISEIISVYEKTGREILLHEIDYRIDKLTTILKKSLFTHKINEERFTFLYTLIRNFRININKKVA